MAYNEKLASKLRKKLESNPKIKIEEKKMFGGLAFMVNGKMCINVSGNYLMCRYDHNREEELSSKKGFEKLIMGKRKLKGYCHVKPEGFKTKKDFDFWVALCLEFNKIAKSSKKRKP